MVAKTQSVSFAGTKAQPILVEAQIVGGLPSFSIVGLADRAVNESRDRIRAAFHAISLALPPKRITINLAPAHIHKEGSHLDLPIAAAILGEMDLLDKNRILHTLFMGELTLDGHLNPVTGILPAAMFANTNAWHFICPKLCENEAAWSGHDHIYPIQTLRELIQFEKSFDQIKPLSLKIPEASFSCTDKDMKDVKGQPFAKRALEVAAAGGHNILMVGPPGSGKSMLASRLSSLLPPLEPKEALDITTIHSIAGILPKEGLVIQRPYRAPHHSASVPALVGGGHNCMPGEISLAHRGVLFLDELPEFSRHVLESLRQPLENGTITISRANARVEYPAQVQLIAAMNPCKCGYYSYDKQRECKRSPLCAQDYQNKISGPLYDRFDMMLHITPIKAEELHAPSTERSSADIQRTVIQARNRQYERSKKAGLPFSLNAYLFGKTLDTFCMMDETSKNFLIRAADRLRLSNRGYFRIVRVARSIADLEGSEPILEHHIKEALSFRQITV